jgi:hypothetical protein
VAGTKSELTAAEVRAWEAKMAMAGFAVERPTTSAITTLTKGRTEKPTEDMRTV